jgi:glycine betaine/proline transport system ATP-binding protein
VNEQQPIVNNEYTLEVKNLWKIFGDDPRVILDSPENRVASRQKLLEETGSVVAIRNISFQVRKGEIFVIMGLSGSGKSTLIRCVLRLIEPTAGQIFINSEDICTFNSKQLMQLRRHSTGMIFQHFGLFPHKNVLDNAAYGLKVRGIKKEERYKKAHEALERVGLKGWENYLPSALSGGMQQRVGIARALANNPDILLMDEPFSGLDPLIRRQMQDEFISLQSEMHKTILFVTHDLDEALKLGNHIAIMKDGEIVQIGMPEEVITSPIDDYVRSFVQDASTAKVVTASSIMEEPIAVVYQWQGPRAALHLLRTNHLESAFVVDSENKLLGMITLQRLINFFKDNGSQIEDIEDIIETDYVTCLPNALMQDLFALAAATPHPIAVVDEEGKLVGEIHDRAIFLGMAQKKSEDRVTEA